jgi:hypothetical protein
MTHSIFILVQFSGSMKNHVGSRSLVACVTQIFSLLC